MTLTRDRIIQSVKTSAWTSILFMVVYGFCNRFTATRSDVYTFYFEWERMIPFVPIFIIPYMSIDFFFVPAPFLCSSDRERKVFSRRITAAILIAGAFFLIMPMRFAFTRPHVDGPLGLIFNNFRKLDLPYNQFPSLHITLRTLLAYLYVHHTKGVLRLLVRVWFALIGFSTILTYQHHLIDIAGGFALATICFYLIPDEAVDSTVTKNPRIGIYYGIGAITLAGFAFVARPWTLWLLWPSGSLGIVASAYFGMGPGIFRKAGGKLPWSTWFVLWPVLAGQWLSMKYYALQCAAWNAVDERVWIGRQLNESEAQAVVKQGVKAVVDLTGEFSEAPALMGVNYLQLPVMDLTAPTAGQLDEAVEFISNHVSLGVVYIHCKAGYSRTAAVAGAYLLAAGKAKTADEAMAILRTERPTIVIRPEAERAIREYASRKGRSDCDRFGITFEFP